MIFLVGGGLIVTGMYLEHYGVKGMRWGKTKINKQNNVFRNRDKNYTSSNSSTPQINTDSKRYEASKQKVSNLTSDKIAKKSMDIGVSAISKLFGKSNKKK